MSRLSCSNSFTVHKTVFAVINFDRKRRNKKEGTTVIVGEETASWHEAMLTTRVLRSQKTRDMECIPDEDHMFIDAEFCSAHSKDR